MLAERLWEAYIKSAKDLYYNKDKFINGEINICFITGQSGSGKSSMAGAMSKGSESIEHIDMDEVVMNRAKRDLEQFKKDMPMAGAFFSGPGSGFFNKDKKDRLPSNKSNTDKVKNHFKKPYDEHNEKITKAFVAFAISYARSHKDTKFVVEGTWIFRFVEPSVLKDCAVCIKGTSAVTSLYRAGKRDNALGANVLSADRWLGREGALEKYRKYFLARMKSDKKEDNFKEELSYYSAQEQFNDIFCECLQGSTSYKVFKEDSNTTVIDFREALVKHIKLNNSKIKDHVKMHYEALVKSCIPLINEAINYTSDYGAFNKYRCWISYNEDYMSGQYRIRFQVSEPTDNVGYINEAHMDDALDILRYENKLFDLSIYGSNLFRQESTTSEDPRKYYEEINNFLESIDIAFDDYDNNHIKFSAKEIYDYYNNAIDTRDALYKVANISESIISDNSRLYTNLLPRYYRAEVDNIKQVYLNMIAGLSNDTMIKKKIYYPGWDIYDWPESADKYFDRNIRKVYPVFFFKRYGYLSVKICEMDKVDNKLTKALKKALSKCIPDKYDLDIIPKDTVGLFIHSEVKDNRTYIYLRTNYFIWR